MNIARAAEELGRHGAEVVMHGPDPARGAVVVDAITAGDGKARVSVTDLGCSFERPGLIFAAFLDFA